MVAKYSSGTKVRIKVVEALRRSPYSDIWKYDNLTGQIVGSNATVGYLVHVWDLDWHRPAQVIQAYRVHLDVGVEIDNVVEECLEALES